jgi:hypothetical protein
MKVEQGQELITILSDDLEGNSPAVAPPIRSPLINSTFPNSIERSPMLISHLPPHVGYQQSLSVVDSLKRLRAYRGARNAFRSLDYDSLDIQRVQFLPPTFNGDVLFELPPVDMSALQSHAKLMHGMDKHHDGHAWTKTIISHIKNNMNLTFRTSTCVGHFHCKYQDCKYTARIHRTSLVNEMEWDGFTPTTFAVGQPAPAGSSLLCKICKVPSIYIATCGAKIYYVFGIANMTCACVHLGLHEHPVKAGKYHEFKERTRTLIGEHVKRTPKATNSAIVMEATKKLVEELLLDLEGVLARKFDLEGLVPILDKCKYMSSPSIKNGMTAFKYIYRGLGSWTASPCLEAVATGPSFRRTSFRVRARTRTRYLFSRCPRWGPDSSALDQNECNPVVIWKTRGSCLIMSSIPSIGRQWLATSMTLHIVEL